MSMIDYGQLWQLALPQTVLVVAALLLLATDLWLLRRRPVRVRFAAGAVIACLGCAVAAAAAALPGAAHLLDGMVVVDPLTRMVEMILLALAALTVILAADSAFTTHVGEYLMLILLAAAGMMFLVSTENLLLIFVSLEMLSLSLYILTGFEKRSARSAEAALKYFLFGGTSAAFLLFGISLLYGLAGSTNLRQIALAVGGPSLDPLAAIAIVMVVVGFGFKVAAVPFHLWAPDTYEAAPAPSAAFIASSSKVASFFVFARVLSIGFANAHGTTAWAGYTPGWAPVIALVAAASMILGNLAAIAQTSVRRLLAYSAVAHAGYMLLGIVAHSERGLSALLYYVTTYALTTIGAFGVVAVVERSTGGDTLSHFAGLSRKSPLLAGSMLIFLLSLAGIPPLAGFFGKFYLFTAVLASASSGVLWLVVLAIAMSAVSLYYYLQVLKRIYIAEAPAGGPASPGPESRIKISLNAQLLLLLLALAVLLLGVFPSVLLDPIQAAISQAR